MKRNLAAHALLLAIALFGLLLLMLMLAVTLSAQPAPQRVVGVLAAENATVVLSNVGSYGQVSIDIESADINASIIFEGRGDGATFWNSMPCWQPSNIPPNSNSGVVTAMTSAGHYLCSPSGFTQVRARMEGYVSGTSTVTIRAVGSATSVATLPNELTVSVVGRVQSYLVTPAGSSLAVKNASPADGDLGLVVRNIPYGTQAVNGTVGVSNLPTAATAPVGTETGLLTREVPYVRRTALTTFPGGTGQISFDVTGAKWLIADFDTGGAYFGNVWFTTYTDVVTSGSGISLAPVFNLRNAFTANAGNVATGRWNFLGETFTYPLLAMPLPPGATTAYLTQTAFTSGSAAVRLYAVTELPDPQMLTVGPNGKGVPEYVAQVGGYDLNTTALKALQLNQGRLLVDGSGATQPISGSVSVSNFPATQPISAAALPLPAGAASAANQTNGTQAARITDGTTTAAVKAASTAAGATDPALVVAVSPNTTVGVTGAFFQATQPISAVALPLPAGAAQNATVSDVRDNTAIIAEAIGVPGDSVPARAMAVGGADPNSGDVVTAVQVSTTTPSALAPGLIVRPIPSGTQTVGGTVAVSASPLPTGAGTILAGTLSATVTAAAVGSGAISKVAIQNDPDNTVDILCGNSTTQAIQIKPGGSMTMEISNLSLLYCKTVSGTATVGYIAR